MLVVRVFIEDIKARLGIKRRGTRIENLESDPTYTPPIPNSTANHTGIDIRNLPNQI